MATNSEDRKHTTHAAVIAYTDGYQAGRLRHLFRTANNLLPRNPLLQ
jgi:hypothetical protein